MKQKFTHLKSFAKLSCALTFALGTFNVAAQTTTVLTEDFATATAGNNTTITASETVYTSANALVKTAWRCYQAGGAIRLGNSTTNDNSNNGYIQTQSTLDLSSNGGNFTVSFDVKGWTTVENDITVAIPGYATQIVSYTATVSDQWQHITLNYTGGKTKRSVTIGTTKRRAFIDNIVISSTVGQTNLATPVIIDPINLETTTFTALWQPVSGATSYIFDLGTDANFSAFLPGYHGVEVTGTSINVTGATGQTSYFCRVYAKNTTQLSVHNMLSLNTACMNMPTIAPQSFCTGSGATVANLTATATGAATIVYAVQEGGEALATNLPLETKSYYVRQVLDGCESSWKKFDVTIVTVATAEVANATQTFCATSAHTVANLVATTTDAANTLQWYPDATTTNALTATTELKTGSYFVAQKLNDCESVRKEVVVTVLSTDKPAGLETQTFCSTTAPTVASLAATASDTATLQWYADATSTDVLAATTAIKSGSYFVTQKLNDCESERKEIAVTVTTVTKPTGLEKQNFTEGQTLVNLEVTANENLVWYSDAALTTVLPKTTVLTDDATYYAAEKIGDCTSAALAITVNKVLGTDNFDAVSFKFYPNPVNDVVNISYSKNITTIVVYNLVGQAVLSATPNATAAQINMSVLSSGYYMVNITAGNQLKTIKLIKQ